MHFNYARAIPKLNGNYVPRIVMPLHFPAETIYVCSQVDVDVEELAFCVSKHKLGPNRFLYTHRLTHIKPKVRKK